MKNNDTWLEGTFEILPTVITPLGSARPIKTFENSSERSKRHKTEELRRTIDTEQLTFVTQMKLRAEGKTDASRIIKDIIKSPKRATKYRKAYSGNLEEMPAQMTPVQALSMFVEAGLSRRQYEIIRNGNRKFYPCYLTKAENKLLSEFRCI